MRKYIKELREGEYVLVTNQEEYRKLCDRLHELDFKWCNGEPYFPYDYKISRVGEVCMHVVTGSFRTKESAVSDGVTIFQLSQIKDFDKEKEVKIDLSDVIFRGDLEGFPHQIAEKMVERQKEQGFEADYSVFENDRSSSGLDKGFCWGEVSEEFSFWYNVISSKQFNTFFKRYPVEEEIPETTFEAGEIVLVSFDGVEYFEKEFILEIKGDKFPYKCKQTGDEGKSEGFVSEGYNFIKKLPKIVTRAELAELLGTKHFRIVD